MLLKIYINRQSKYNTLKIQITQRNIVKFYIRFYNVTRTLQSISRHLIPDKVQK
jgi:hypothetical protein